MQERIRQLFHAMIAFDAGDPDLIQHFTKVHSYAKLIAESEGLDGHTIQVLEAAALVHDIGIPLCNKKYGAHPGPLQEKEGPPLAREMLSRLDFTKEEIDRVCTLVGEHHTYHPIDGVDHQILLEADFIVNSFENQHSRETLYHTWRHIFATETGKRIYAVMFGLTPDGQA
ncbi:MAG: HD domain-containing protein [Clostridia bacterium]|nr:HD domain-containing protein [Clostridia bacterium]